MSELYSMADHEFGTLCINCIKRSLNHDYSFFGGFFFFTEFENQQYVKLIEAENQQIAGMMVIFIIKI